MKRQDRMKIAILGSRGIPAVIGGFETFSEEVGTRLAARGHEITVYCESTLYPKPRKKEYRGVRLVYIPAAKSKSFEALSYDFLCIFHSLFHKYDLLYMLADNTAVLLTLAKIFGKKIVINTDGVEWLRSKWPWYGKLFIKFNEWMATKLTPHLIVDSREMGTYYEKRYARKTTYITNGAERIESKNPEKVEALELKPGRYCTVICRLEPENNIETIIKEFKKTDDDVRLTIASPHEAHFQYILAKS
jgi:glycosyltransferase involved in cell wall biosynthesis